MFSTLTMMTSRLRGSLGLPLPVSILRKFISQNKNIYQDWFSFVKVGYATYFPADFQQPIFDKNVLTKMEESSELDELKYKSFLPASATESSSVFYDETYESFINYIMTGGNRSTARKLMERTFYEIKRIQLQKYHKEKDEEIECNPLVILHTAIENCSPLLIVTPVKRAGIVYQVPTPVTDEKAKYLGIKWLLEAARDKDLKTHLPITLSKELIDAFNREGRVIKKKQDVHKLCEANKAYMHYRWSG